MKAADPALLDGIVSPTVLAAMKRASEALTRVGVRHVVVGGLAVGAYGYPRATRDVNFLVGDETFENHEGGLVTLRGGVPFQVNGVAVVIYLKLKSPRLKDRVDVVELIKGGIDADRCRAYLAQHAPPMLELFDEAVARAAAEE